MPTPRLLSKMLIALAAVSGLGCSFVGTLEDCADLAATVNPVLQSVAQDETAARQDPQLYRKIATRYDGIARALEQKRYASAELSALVVDYALLFDETAKNTLRFADAMVQANRIAQRTARQTARKNATRQRSYVRRIEAVCRGQ